MEVFLLVVLFGFLIYIINNLKSRFNTLEDDIKTLSKKIDLLKAVEKPAETFQPAPIPVVKQEEIKIIEEQSKPITPEPVRKEVIEEKISDEQLKKLPYPQPLTLLNLLSLRQLQNLLYL